MVAEAAGDECDVSDADVGCHEGFCDAAVLVGDRIGDVVVELDAAGDVVVGVVEVGAQVTDV